jgi:hypothetical protein
MGGRRAVKDEVAPWNGEPRVEAEGVRWCAMRKDVRDQGKWEKLLVDFYTFG